MPFINRSPVSDDVESLNVTYSCTEPSELSQVPNTELC